MTDVIRSGVGPIDESLGGLLPGRAHVLTGATGAGKTTACLHFLNHGVKAGERCALLTTDDPADLFAQAAFLGIDLSGHVLHDRLVIVQYQPEFVRRFCRAVAPGAAVEELGQLMGEPVPGRLAIDSLAPVLDTGSAAAAGIDCLLQYLQQSGVSALVTHSADPTGQRDAQLEHLLCRAAALLHIQIERDGSRALQVRKARFPVRSAAQARFSIEPGVGFVPVAKRPVEERRLQLEA